MISNICDGWKMLIFNELSRSHAFKKVDKYEPQHEISNNVVGAISKASDQRYAQADQSLC